MRKDLCCPSFAPPRAPAALSVVLEGRIIRAAAAILEPRRLVDDPGPVVFPKLVAYRYPGACPAAPGDGPPLREGGVGYGAWTGDVELVPPPGTWCYAFAVEDATGRRSSFSTTPLVVAPPAPAPTPSAAAAPR